MALAGSSEGVVARTGATASVSGWASYEHICYWLDSLFGTATPSGSYIYAYAAPLATAPTCRMMTIVNSDGTVGGYNITSGVVTSWTLSGEAGEPLMFNADLIGYGMAADTLESLTAPDVTPIMMSQVGSVKWDTWAGTMGGSSLTSCFVRSFELTANANRVPRVCIGAITPTEYFENIWEGSLRVTLEFNATTKADVTAIVGGTLTQKQIELNWASGSNALQLQFAGTASGQPEIFGDEDGAVTVDIEFNRTYHATFANWLKATVTNSLSALT